MMPKSSARYFAALVEEHRSHFASDTYMGIPLSRLNAEQLRACVCELGRTVKGLHEDNKHNMDFMEMLLLRKRKRS